MSSKTTCRSIPWLIFGLLSLGCTMLAERRMVEEYGAESVQDRIKPLSPDAHEEWRRVKSVLDSRCVVCHSCYDAPCQLKLTSAAGIDRGASKALVYDSTRLLASDPTRLGVDTGSTAEWRTKAFFPVLNERTQNPAANLQSSALYRLLELKRNADPPAEPVLPGDYDFSLDRKQDCPVSAELDRFELEHPLWGMPFGFPALSDEEHSAMKRWIESGAAMPAPAPLSAALETSVREWETFLNGGSLKEKLMSRYLYEHLFLGDLYFDEADSSRAFRLVRSATPAGEPVSIIASRRPTDDPEIEKFYYRLVPEEETLVAKTHMPYALNGKRMKRYRELFLDAPYAVTNLPGYDRKTASNPFKVFEQMPPSSRYRFMLDEAQYFVMGFIKGPVCRGHIALSVIDDQFWVFFLDPGFDRAGGNAEFLAQESDLLSLPSESGSNASALFNWRRYSAQEKTYLAAKRKYLTVLADKGVRPGLHSLWSGEGENANAALTVFRHYDSATVVQGLIGPPPKTAWVMSYPTFERIHYLLVAEFDIFGNLGHQLLTRLYMDFLRVESENNFLMLLPKSERAREHDSWYRGIGANNNDYTFAPENFEWSEPDIVYTTDRHKQELFEKLRSGFAPVLNRRYERGPGTLDALARLQGKPIAILPEMSILQLTRASGADEVYTLLLNRAHENVGVLYLENRRLVPAEDTLSVVPGFLGAYPNAFFSIGEAELDSFTTGVATLQSEADYGRLLDRFGIRRTDPEFWRFSDGLQAERRRRLGANAGVFDFSRFENR